MKLTQSDIQQAYHGFTALINKLADHQLSLGFPIPFSIQYVPTCSRTFA